MSGVLRDNVRYSLTLYVSTALDISYWLEQEGALLLTSPTQVKDWEDYYKKLCKEFPRE